MGYRALFCFSLFLGITLIYTVWISKYNNSIKKRDKPDTGDRDIRFEAVRSFCSCKRSSPSVKNQTTFHWCSEESTLRGFNQSIIAYSLYGQYKNGTGIRSKYFSAANLIPQQAREFYPGWQIRVYHDIGVNQHHERKLICDVYCNNDNVDLCDVNKLYDTWEGVRNRTHQLHPIKDLRKINRMVWRTLPLLDHQVGTLMVRDMDSEINRRELAAVQQWFQSNRTFHVMRDHQHHCDPRYKILGGLFGIKIHQQRDLIQDLTTKFISRSSKEAWGEDQKLLTKIFWPVVRRDAMIHDSYCCELKWGSLPVTYFPTQRENLTFVSDRRGSTWTKVVKCPVKCRPPDHTDWEYC